MMGQACGRRERVVMGEIADDHFVELYWSEGTGIGGDGGFGPPCDAPEYGGMNAWMARRVSGVRAPGLRRISEAKPQHVPVQARPHYMSIYELIALGKERGIGPCPHCGSGARVIEYPLGISCSRGVCMPGKIPIYLSEADAVRDGFVSVVERWNAARLGADGSSLVWPTNAAETANGTPAPSNQTAKRRSASA